MAATAKRQRASHGTHLEFMLTLQVDALHLDTHDAAPLCLALEILPGDGIPSVHAWHTCQWNQ